MVEIPNESIQLVVTSPPYPMIQKWDELFGVVDFEKQHKILDVVWGEVERVLIPGGIAAINIGDATRSIDGVFQCFPNYARITMEFMRLGFCHLIPILWKKISSRPNAFLGSGMYPPNAYVAQDCEYIALFRKGRIRKFASGDNNRVESMYTKEERDKWFQQIWNIPGKRGAGVTSAYPEEVPYRLIRMFSCIGDTVLDPFGGTMTTGKVAIDLDRYFIGYEIKESI